MCNQKRVPAHIGHFVHLVWILQPCASDPGHDLNGIL